MGNAKDGISSIEVDRVATLDEGIMQNTEIFTLHPCNEAFAHTKYCKVI